MAWDHGPVAVSIYHAYKCYGWQGIDRPTMFDITAYPPEIRELLDVVYRVYGQFTAARLERMTHDEPPWRNVPRNGAISLESLKEFFTRLVEAGRENRAEFGEPVWPTLEFCFQSCRSISARMGPHREKLRQIARRASNAANPWVDDD